MCGLSHHCSALNNIAFYHLDEKQSKVRNKDLKVNLDQHTLISVIKAISFLILKIGRIILSCLVSVELFDCCLAPGLSCWNFG